MWATWFRDALLLKHRRVPLQLFNSVSIFLSEDLLSFLPKSHNIFPRPQPLRFTVNDLNLWGSDFTSSYPGLECDPRDPGGLCSFARRVSLPAHAETIPLYFTPVKIPL